MDVGWTQVEVVGAKACSPQNIDGSERHRAVRATTVGDDLAVFWQLIEPHRELTERDVKSAGQMKGLPLLNRTNIEEGRFAIGDLDKELLTRWLAVDLQRVLQPIEIGQERLTKTSQAGKERIDIRR